MADRVQFEIERSENGGLGGTPQERERGLMDPIVIARLYCTIYHTSPSSQLLTLKIPPTVVLACADTEEADLESFSSLAVLTALLTATRDDLARTLPHSSRASALTVAISAPVDGQDSLEAGARYLFLDHAPLFPGLASAGLDPDESPIDRFRVAVPAHVGSRLRPVVLGVHGRGLGARCRSSCSGRPGNSGPLSPRAPLSRWAWNTTAPSSVYSVTWPSEPQLIKTFPFGSVCNEPWDLARDAVAGRVEGPD